MPVLTSQTTDQVHKQTGISKPALYHYIKKGYIPGMRLTRNGGNGRGVAYEWTPSAIALAVHLHKNSHLRWITRRTQEELEEIERACARRLAELRGDGGGGEEE